MDTSRYFYPYSSAVRHMDALCRAYGYGTTDRHHDPATIAACVYANRGLHLLPEQDGAGHQPRHDTSDSTGDVRASVA